MSITGLANTALGWGVSSYNWAARYQLPWLIGESVTTYLMTAGVKFCAKRTEAEAYGELSAPAQRQWRVRLFPLTEVLPLSLAIYAFFGLAFRTHGFKQVPPQTWTAHLPLIAALKYSDALAVTRLWPTQTEEGCRKSGLNPKTGLQSGQYLPWKSAWKHSHFWLLAGYLVLRKVEMVHRGFTRAHGLPFTTLLQKFRTWCPPLGR